MHPQPCVPQPPMCTPALPAATSHPFPLSCQILCSGTSWDGTLPLLVSLMPLGSQVASPSLLGLFPRLHQTLPDQLTWKGVRLSLKIKTVHLELNAPLLIHRLPQPSDIHSECNPPCHQLGHHCTSIWKEAYLNTPQQQLFRSMFQGHK